MKTEEEEHYSSDRNHWCLVKYVGGTPFYYAGWFGKNTNEDTLKPAIVIDFNSALKLHSKIAAQSVLNGLKSCYNDGDFKVEDHRWM